MDGERAGHSVGQGTCLGGMALAEDMFSSSVGILNFSKCIVQDGSESEVLSYTEGISALNMNRKP